MTISELKKAASEKDSVTQRAIGYRAEKIKSKYGPFSDEIAYGIVAQKTGVEVSKIITDSIILEQIRDQLDRIAEIESDQPKIKTKTIVKTTTVNIGNDFKLNDPILSRQVLNDAKDMTQFYAELYIFENSVREVINRVLTSNLGTNWWSSTAVRKELIDKVQGRKDKEDKNPWHGRRGAHPIYYTDMSDLNYLVKRHWNFFSNIFPRLTWVSEKLEEISFSRNVVDHHNPLNKRDRTRLKMNIQDWQKQIDANKSNL